MIPKYTIEYATSFRRHTDTRHYSTDDPVAAKEFLEELLDRQLRINAIHHDGVDLPRRDFDEMIKEAAKRLAARRICTSLGISPEEEHFRFGLAA